MIVAPYHAVCCPVVYKDESQKELANKLYEDLLKEHVEVILDDRDARLGFKLADWELIGIPYVIIIGKKASEGIVELKDRQTNEKKEMSYQEALNIIVKAVKNIM